MPRNRRSATRLPIHTDFSGISISSMRNVRLLSLSIRSRKLTTCGRSTSLAMRIPPIWFGETVESAPAFISRSANFWSMQRATILRSGFFCRASTVMIRFSLSVANVVIMPLA